MSRYQHYPPTRTRLTRTHFGNPDNSSTSQTHHNVIYLTPSSPASGWDERLRHIHISPPTRCHPLLIKTIHKLPPARQARTCVLSTKASTRLRHPLVQSTPSRFQPSTPPPTHAPDTPPHSHISITFFMKRHSATAISSIPTCYVAMSTITLTTDNSTDRKSVV